MGNLNDSGFRPHQLDAGFNVAFESAQQATALLFREAFEQLQTPPKAGNKDENSLTSLAPHFWQSLGKKETEGITRKELQDAFSQKKDLSPADAAVLCVLRDQFATFAKPNATEIKLGDLSTYTTMAERVHKKDALIGALERRHEDVFKLLDQDKNGRLSNKEVTDAAADPKAPADLKTVLDFIRDNFAEIEKADPQYKQGTSESITLAGVQKFVEQSHHNANWESSTIRSIDATIRDSTASNWSRELFADKTDPLKSIKPEAVKQGGIGDCYFLSAMASLAEIKPEAIKKMIEDNGDGTYTVTFPYTPNEHIKVTKPSNQELLTYARGSEHGIWPAVMEKAYGQWINASIWRRNFFTNPKPSDQPQDNANGGSIFHHGLIVLTGGFPMHYFLTKDVNHDRIAQHMADAMKNQRAMTAVTALKQTDPFLPTQHEYSVLGYDEKNKIVTIRNPWGSFEARDSWGKAKDGKDDGIFKMSLADFCNKFSGLAVSRRTPPG